MTWASSANRSRMLPPVEVVPALSKALRYSRATDLRCSSVMAWVRQPWDSLSSRGMSDRARPASRPTGGTRESVPGRRQSDSLEERGQALATADAHRLQPVAGVAAGHRAGEGSQDPAAGGPDRVPQGDARAVDVHPVEVARREAPLAGHREHLASEGLVELD